MTPVCVQVTRSMQRSRICKTKLSPENLHFCDVVRYMFKLHSLWWHRVLHRKWFGSPAHSSSVPRNLACCAGWGCGRSGFQNNDSSSGEDQDPGSGMDITVFDGTKCDLGIAYRPVPLANSLSCSPWGMCGEQKDSEGCLLVMEPTAFGSSLSRGWFVWHMLIWLRYVQTATLHWDVELKHSYCAAISFGWLIISLQSAVENGSWSFCWDVCYPPYSPNGCNSS